MKSEDYKQYQQQLEKLNQPGGILSANSPYATTTWGRELSDHQKERADRIIAKYLGDTSKYQSNGYSMLMTGGAPGAGKSVLLEQRANELEIYLENFLIIDPDKARQLLLEDMVLNGELPTPPELSNGIDGIPIAPGELASLVQVEASRIADEIVKEAIKNRWNFVYDSSMNSSYWANELLEQCRRANYNQVEVVVADADLDTVVPRAINRWLPGRQAYDAGHDPIGGRFMPAGLVAPQFDDNGRHSSYKVATALAEAGEAERVLIVSTVTGEVLRDTDHPPQGPTWPIAYVSAVQHRQRAPISNTGIHNDRGPNPTTHCLIHTVTKTPANSRTAPLRPNSPQPHRPRSRIRRFGVPGATPHTRLPHGAQAQYQPRLPIGFGSH